MPLPHGAFGLCTRRKIDRCSKVRTLSRPSRRLAALRTRLQSQWSSLPPTATAGGQQFPEASRRSLSASAPSGTEPNPGVLRPAPQATPAFRPQPKASRCHPDSLEHDLRRKANSPNAAPSERHSRTPSRGCRIEQRPSAVAADTFPADSRYSVAAPAAPPNGGTRPPQPRRGTDTTAQSFPAPALRHAPSSTPPRPAIPPTPRRLLMQRRLRHPHTNIDASHQIHDLLIQRPNLRTQPRQHRRPRLPR